MAATTTRTRARTRARNAANAATDPAGAAAPTPHNVARALAMTAGVPTPAPAPINTPDHVNANRKRATVQTAADPAVASAVRFARYALHAHMPAFRGTDRRPNAASSSDHI